MKLHYKDQFVYHPCVWVQRWKKIFGEYPVSQKVIQPNTNMHIVSFLNIWTLSLLTILFLIICPCKNISLPADVSKYCQMQGLPDKSMFQPLARHSTASWKWLGITIFPIYSIHFFWASEIKNHLPSQNLELSRAAGQWICQALPDGWQTVLTLIRSHLVASHLGQHYLLSPVSSKT